jgi:hypothetical protein
VPRKAQEPPEEKSSGGSLILDREYYDWADRGLCREFYKTNPDFFFENKTREQAKLICKGACEVRLQCLLFALENDQQDGVWGGTDYSERKSMSFLKHNQQSLKQPHLLSQGNYPLSDPACPTSVPEAC